MRNRRNVSSRKVRDPREFTRQCGTDKHGAPHSTEHFYITTRVANRGHATHGNPESIPESLYLCDFVPRPEVDNRTVWLKTNANEVIDVR
jgi:hypothetical protein